MTPMRAILPERVRGRSAYLRVMGAIYFAFGLVLAAFPSPPATVHVYAVASTIAPMYVWGWAWMLGSVFMFAFAHAGPRQVVAFGAAQLVALGWSLLTLGTAIEQLTFSTLGLDPFSSQLFGRSLASGFVFGALAVANAIVAGLLDPPRNVRGRE